MIRIVYTNSNHQLEKLDISVEHFPNGELKIKKISLPLNNIIMMTYYVFDKDTMHQDLFVLKNLKRTFEKDITEGILFISFLPYSRMDRDDRYHMHTLPIILNELAELNFSHYIITDPHNPKVIFSEVDNDFAEKIIPYYPTNTLIKKALEKIGSNERYQIVYPDKGATEKYNKGILETNNSANGEKVRNPENGYLEYTRILNLDLKVNTYIIVDDLCSGGMTFKLCAEKIKKENLNAKVFLVVSHFEENGGKSILNNSSIEHIYTTDSMCTTDHPKITQLKLFRQ